jgi:ERCC4-related helicase
MMKLDEESMKTKGPKASREIVSTKEFKEAWTIVSTTKVEHPKISRVMSLVSKEINSGRDTRVIVFSQYRDTCDMLVGKLSAIENVRVAKLIGQSNGGLKQKEQIGLLDDFRTGKYNTIVSTSVGEEGLDVTSTDMVIFYEPVPSEIRTIQRRGRTGRKNTGEVYVLVAKGTRDEVFENTSKKKEEQMREHLEKMNMDLKKHPPADSRHQMKLAEF